MSVWRYRDEARKHVLEFVELGYFWPEPDRQAMHALALANPKSVDEWIRDHRLLVLDLVELIPSRREKWLRGLAKGHGATQFVAILGAWQACRKAVLAYDWLMENESRFSPGQSYRSATASQSMLFDELRARRWTKWPFQWGASPFPGEKSRRDPFDAPDYDQILDRYDPETGKW